MTGDIHILFFLEMGSLMTSSSSAGPIQISKFPEPCHGNTVNLARLHSIVSSAYDCRSPELESQLGLIIFMEIEHEIISTAILTLLRIQEGQLSVTDESICTSTGYPFRGLSLPRNCT